MSDIETSDAGGGSDLSIFLCAMAALGAIAGAAYLLGKRRPDLGIATEDILDPGRVKGLG
ncbi:MAG TPA: hypothetical protein VF552_12890 [Allosphingosinicella sp.]|jgi:hypothetical protein